MHSFRSVVATYPLSLRKNAGSTFYISQTDRKIDWLLYILKITNQKIKAVSYSLNKCLATHAFL